jgi:hypothetical protein
MAYNSDTGSETVTYPKKGASDGVVGNTGRSSDSKELASGPLEMTKAGGMSGSGPTGSSRTYAKGSKVSTDANRFNPMKAKISTFAVGGVGKGED